MEDKSYFHVASTSSLLPGDRASPDQLSGCPRCSFPADVLSFPPSSDRIALVWEQEEGSHFGLLFLVGASVLYCQQQWYMVAVSLLGAERSTCSRVKRQRFRNARMHLVLQTSTYGVHELVGVPESRSPRIWYLPITNIDDSRPRLLI